MRWKCPHCEVALSVADEKLQEEWNFFRCYQCRGFAMIKRPEVKMIKVDRPKDDGSVILSNEAPYLMGQTAVQKLAQYMNSANGKNQPKVIPASRRKPNTTTVAAKTNPTQENRTPPTPPKVETHGVNVKQGALPEPLPDEPRRPWYHRFLPVLIAGTTVIMLGAASMIYVQTKTLALRETARDAVDDSRDTEAAANEQDEIRTAKAKPIPAQAAK